VPKKTLLHPGVARVPATAARTREWRSPGQDGPGFFMYAINPESLFITGSALSRLTLLAQNIGNMPDGMGKQQRIVLGTAESNRSP